MSANPHRDLVFISYGHTNPVWRDRLLVLLKPFVRRGELQEWADTYIEAGALAARDRRRAELGGVVRDEPEAEAACVSGNEEIVDTDHLASFFSSALPRRRW